MTPGDLVSWEEKTLRPGHYSGGGGRRVGLAGRDLRNHRISLGDLVIQGHGL